MEPSCTRLARQMQAPPDRFSEVRGRLIRIKMRLQRERGGELLAEFRGAPPSEVKKQLEGLQRRLGGLGPAARHGLQEALDDELWGDPAPADDELRVIMRVYNQAVLRGTLGRDTGSVVAPAGDMPPLIDIVEQAIGRAIDRLEERKRGAKPAIGDPGLRAAQAVIDLYCEVHKAPAPLIADIADRTVTNSAAAEFAITCLCDWRHPRAIEIDDFDLVRALSR